MKSRSIPCKKYENLFSIIQGKFKKPKNMSAQNERELSAIPKTSRSFLYLLYSYEWPETLPGLLTNALVLLYTTFNVVIRLTMQR
jgi:hypothetical protein